MIEDWTPRVSALFAQLPDLRAVYGWDNLPGKLLAFPCLVWVTRTGTVSRSAGAGGFDQHRLTATVYVASAFLPPAFRTAVPYIGHMAALLGRSIRLKDFPGVEDFGPAGDPFYEGPGNVAYAGTDHTGVVFNLLLRERLTAPLIAT